jgi:hypothetical protein
VVPGIVLFLLLFVQKRPDFYDRILLKISQPTDSINSRKGRIKPDLPGLHLLMLQEGLQSSLLEHIQIQSLGKTLDPVI